MWHSFKFAQKTNLTGLKGLLSFNAHAPWLFCWVVQVQKKTYDCISHCLKGTLSTTNRTLLIKALPYNCVTLFLHILSILILTLTSLHHWFLGLIILQNTYILLFIHIWISNLTYTVTLILLPIGSKKAAGKVSIYHKSRAESWHEQF